LCTRISFAVCAVLESSREPFLDAFRRLRRLLVILQSLGCWCHICWWIPTKYRAGGGWPA
jgi:hypothetical protein